MNKIIQASLVFLVAVVFEHVYAQPTTTPCSLSIYRYLYNLPGEKIRPNLPASTYIFGKQIGPEEAQGSDPKPSILKPTTAAPEYLPPSAPSTTFLPPQPVSTTYYPPPTFPSTTKKPSTSAPIYIPPNPYFPEASNTIAVKSVKPDCDNPAHKHQTPLPFFPQYDLPKLPQATFFYPQVDIPQQPPKPIFPSYNQIIPQFKFAAPTPPSSIFISKPTENCDKHIHVSSTALPSTTPEVLETRQKDVVILPDPLQVLDAPKADCGHPEHQHQFAETKGYPQQSLGVPSEDYGVSSQPDNQPAPSAGYSYDKPSPSFGYPQVTQLGYNYPKPSPSFDFPGYSKQATSYVESESDKSKVSTAKEDGDLVILKV
ncbi:uncharacterized protein LOC126895558 [Daktulosphaira vitifoliae]|uniref:uncharacterized protein LOC126895558 n=1 Tax=Daktulosphaira vitifoliae TaxID=58002 RepID=UPI0021AACBE2|nr:uncharacterized protein LOC126895558 [Daktulosphaira vitifoliae]